LYYEKNNARFLNVPILFSQHEHRILTGQKPYFKRVLPLFSRPTRYLTKEIKQLKEDYKRVRVEADIEFNRILTDFVDKHYL